MLCSQVRRREPRVDLANAHERSIRGKGHGRHTHVRHRKAAAHIAESCVPRVCLASNSEPAQASEHQAKSRANVSRHSGACSHRGLNRHRASQHAHGSTRQCCQPKMRAATQAPIRQQAGQPSPPRRAQPKPMPAQAHAWATSKAVNARVEQPLPRQSGAREAAGSHCP